MILRNKEDVRFIGDYYIFDYKGDVLYDICMEYDNFNEFKSIIKSGHYHNVIEQLIAEEMIDKGYLE